MFRKLISLATLLFCALSVFAGGKRDVTERQVENMDSWQETFDINEKKAGKYNILVTVDDKGGNQTVGGPFNIFIDPESDYPVTGITNPIKNMRVPGNLNIVGTCIDDDGVKEVWLVLDKGKKDAEGNSIEQTVKAEGKEFWSYYLDTTLLDEGPHTIEVYGVDVNDLSSAGKANKISTVTWNLDRRQPVTAVTNHGLGELVSGKIVLKGTVNDGNGIKGLTYSLDNGEHYLDAKIGFDKKDSLWKFEIPVDTTKFKDGPSVIWFKAMDNMGSEGVYSYLYFVDNTKPDVRIVYPKDDSVVNGKIGVAGYAKDVIGLKSLKWSFNGKSGAIELIPGNPYWYVEVDSKGLNKSAVFEITAEDTVKNIVTVKKDIKINQEADKPTVVIDFPSKDALVDGEPGTVYLRGIAADDDGIATISYKLDNEAEQTLEAQGVFYAPLSSDKVLANGEHTVTVYATDIYGVKGDSKSVKFKSHGVKPAFDSPKLSGKDFVPGALVNPESNPVFSTSVSAPCGIKSVSYKVESGNGEVVEEKTMDQKEPAKTNRVPVSISLSKAPWGLVTVSVTAEDIYGAKVTQTSAVNVKDLSYIHKDVLTTPFENQIVNEPAAETDNIKIAISAINGASYEPGMNVEVTNGQKAGSFVTVTVSNVPADAKGKFILPSVSYTIDGEAAAGGDKQQSGKISGDKEFKNLGEGNFEVQIPLNNLPSRITHLSVKAEVKSGQNVFTSSAKGTFCVVRKAPEKKSNYGTNKVFWTPEGNVTYNESLKAYVLAAGTPLTAYANMEAELVKNDATEENPVETYSAKVEAVSVPAGFAATVEGKTIRLVPEKDGFYKNVALTVKGAHGRVTSEAVNVYVDSEAPKVAISAPANHLWVQNRTTLTVDASDANGIAKVEYTMNRGAEDEKWVTVDQDKKSGLYAASLVFEAAEDGLINVDVRATDTTGKVSYTATAIQKDTTKPSVEVLVPAAEDVINGENTVAFLVTDAGRLSKAEYVAPKTNAKIPVELGPLVVTNIGKPGDDKVLNDAMSVNFYDEVGNVTEVKKWEFIIDNKSDLPVAEVHLPVENFVVTRDFEISGVVLDDDGPCKIYYKIDNGEYRLAKEELDTSFSIQVALNSMSDNEHSVTVYAVDINGTKGPEFVRNFRVSLEEPKGAVKTPAISSTVKEIVKVSGVATDKNGIQAVYVSLDNGNSFNQTKGVFGHDKTETNWTYEFDTRVVQDGTHVLFVKIVDWYGIEGLYSSLINIDNTNPSIDLELPLDDSTTTGMIFFSGQTTDNIGLKSLFITVRSLEGKVVASKLARTDLVPAEIIAQSMDLSSLDNGFYNIELTGTDAADNVTRVSRNVQLNKNKPVAKLDLLYPLNGEHVQGSFNIYGTAISDMEVENLELFVGKEKVADSTLSASNYFKFFVTPDMIGEGQHNIYVQANLKNGKKILSNMQYLNYKKVGPWVTIDNLGGQNTAYGDFAMERPYLAGEAGYVVDEEEKAAVKAKGATKEMKAALEAKRVEKVEISLNNGKTFDTVSTDKKWKYRIENEDIAEGYHFLLIRATMANGETAVTRCIVQVDKTKPTIKLISPGEGGRYNQNLEFSGLAHDDVALKNVTLTLRKGDKASYEVPAFIQGLYLDAQFWGATFWSAGAGLTFFDDNVKLQFQFGQFTQEQRNIFSNTNQRYGGDVIGGKILANVAYFPFRYYFGPDWEWLSANIAVGANFSRFSESGAGKPQVLSAMLAQLEFPRISFDKKQKMFRTIALYTEGQLWFIPSDVSSETEVQSIVPQISIGLRVNVF